MGLTLFWSYSHGVPMKYFCAVWLSTKLLTSRVLWLLDNASQCFCRHPMVLLMPPEELFYSIYHRGRVIA